MPTPRRAGSARPRCSSGDAGRYTGHCSMPLATATAVDADELMADIGHLPDSAEAWKAGSAETQK